MKLLGKPRLKRPKSFRSTNALGLFLSLRPFRDNDESDFPFFPRFFPFFSAFFICSLDLSIAGCLLFREDFIDKAHVAITFG